MKKTINKKKINWTYGGVIGIIIGLVWFMMVARDQFFSSLNESSAWRALVITILPPCIAGALIPLVYYKLRKFKINKYVFWSIFLLIIIILLSLIVVWFLALEVAIGIGGIS